MLDQGGKPQAFSVGPDQSLRACLRIGNCYLDRQGNLTPDRRMHRDSK
jgi:hypothetical protein